MNLLDFITVSYTYSVPLNWIKIGGRGEVILTFQYLHKNSSFPYTPHAHAFIFCHLYEIFGHFAKRTQSIYVEELKMRHKLNGVVSLHIRKYVQVSNYCILYFITVSTVVLSLRQ